VFTSTIIPRDDISKRVPLQQLPPYLWRRCALEIPRHLPYSRCTSRILEPSVGRRG